MRAKPDMKPWVFTDKNKMSSFRSGTNSAGVGAFAFGGVPPLRGSKKWISMPNPWLAPWALQGYRPYRAPLRLLNQYTLLFYCGCPACLLRPLHGLPKDK